MGRCSCGLGWARACSGVLLALALVVGSLPPGTLGRVLLVGNYTSLDNAWTAFADYTVWTRENPLYIGDIVVFRYFRYQSVVWILPNRQAWETCTYDEAIVFGNDTAGIGLGLPYTVTAQPKYFASGVFGECEEFEQKVIIKATLGPLPKKPMRAPAEIPNPFPSPPPPAPRPRSPPPPPPLFRGLLYKIFSTKSGSKFSSFYRLLSPLAAEIEASAKRAPLTLLAPSNSALEAFSQSMDTALSFMPTPGTKELLIQRLLKFHVITRFLLAKDFPLLKGSLKTLLGQPLRYSASLASFRASDQPYGKARLRSPDLHRGQGAPTKSRISVQGIDGVLFPASLQSLIPKSALKKLKFGVDPPLPTIKISKDIKTELDRTLPDSGFWAIKDLYFSNFTAAVNGSAGNLWPYLASLGGVTLLAPADEAFADAQWKLTEALAKASLSAPSFLRWLRNLVLYHSILGFRGSSEWLWTTPGQSFPTALSQSVVFHSSKDGIVFWYSKKNAPQFNPTFCFAFPDLQSGEDTLISIQGVTKIIFPQNKTRLVPASAISI